MFERLTDDSRRVVVLANWEAQQLQHDRVGTGHLLIGALCVAVEHGVRGVVRPGVGPDEARPWVVRNIGTGSAVQSEHLPFTARAKEALEGAVRLGRERHRSAIVTPLELFD